MMAVVVWMPKDGDMTVLIGKSHVHRLEKSFIQLMLSYLHERTLNAKQFCQLMYWVGRAGVQDAIKYGLALGAPSGHYQRKLDLVLEKQEERRGTLQYTGSWLSQA